MLKNKKIISLIILSILSCSLFIHGCSKNNSKKSAEIYCAAIYKSETNNIESIDLDTSELADYKENCQYNFCKAISDPIESIGFNYKRNLTDDVWDAFQEKISNVKFEVKEVSSKDNKAQIEITSTYIDLKSIKDKAANDALNETGGTVFYTEDNSAPKFSTNSDYKFDSGNAFADAYLKNLKKEIENAELSTQKAKRTIKFDKKDDSWIPKDPYESTYELIQIVTNNELPDLDSDEQSVSAEENAQNLWNSAINNDLDGIEKLGYNEAFAKKYLDIVNKDIYKKFIDNISISSKYPPTDEQAEKLIDAIKYCIKNNPVSFTITNGDDISLDLKATTSQLDLKSVKDSARNKLGTSLYSSSVQDKQQLVDDYYYTITQELKTLKPSSTTEQNNFTFFKRGNLQLPFNSVSFVDSLINMMIKYY